MEQNLMLNEMAVFAQVVDSGSFTAAAKVLGLNTSAVSRHVARLESHLGGRLLQRTTRSFTLTELGRHVYAASTRMVGSAREVQALAGSYSARPNGLIRVTAPVVFGQAWLAPRLAGFLERYPEVDIHLTLADRMFDLIEEGTDLAIRIASELAPGLAARPLCAMEYLLVASPAYLAARGEPASPQALAGHLCCHLGYGPFGKSWVLARGDSIVRIDVGARVAINNSAAILAAVEAGGGIGLIPDFTARAALAAGRVRRVLPEWAFGEPYTGSVHAVYVPGPHLALKVRAFIDYLAAG